MLNCLLHIFTILIPSVIFNFYYLPLKQAVKLPILLTKPRFRKLKGRVVIESDTVHMGMIRLGEVKTNLFPHNGISWYNEGTVIFKGEAVIGADSYIVVRPTGRVEFGANFASTAALKLVSCIGISFGKGTLLGWNVIVTDSQFHPLYDTEKKCFKKAYGKIRIGDYNWFSTQCMIMHSVETPEHCIFGARSIVTKGGHFESYCVHGGSPLRILSTNTMRIKEHDQITEYIE